MHFQLALNDSLEPRFSSWIQGYAHSDLAKVLDPDWFPRDHDEELTAILLVESAFRRPGGLVDFFGPEDTDAELSLNFSDDLDGGAAIWTLDLTVDELVDADKDRHSLRLASLWQDWTSLAPSELRGRAAAVHIVRTGIVEANFLLDSFFRTHAAIIRNLVD